MKKSSDLSRLLGYAGGRRVLTYLSWVLSAVSALVALVPFWYIWRILKEVLETAPDFAAAIHIVPWGWRAVGFAVLSVLLYIAGLMCSHLAAFRIATNLRLALTEHIARLPLGQIQVSGSGKLRRTIADTAGAAETFLAHQLPDQYRAMATVAGLLVLLLAFDWRLGLLSLLPVALGFACMSTMTGKSMQEKMTEYQNALADMSNQAVEYVRGIPVVKTFGQTVFSFKKFKDTIDNYQRWTIAYTKQLRGPMTAYTLAVNSVFVFLIVGGFWLSGKGVTAALLLDLHRLHQPDDAHHRRGRVRRPQPVPVSGLRGRLLPGLHPRGRPGRAPVDPAVHHEFQGPGQRPGGAGEKYPRLPPGHRGRRHRHPGGKADLLRRPQAENEPPGAANRRRGAGGEEAEGVKFVIEYKTARTVLIVLAVWVK